MSTAWIWLQFGVCLGLIGLAGHALIRHGETLAALTGLSQGWIGLVLLSTVTSLPELVTGIGSVTLANSPDLAIGDVLGSCVFNLLILGLLGLLQRQPATSWRKDLHKISAGFGLLLLTTACLILLAARTHGLPSWGPVNVGSILLLVLYLLSIRTMYRAEVRSRAPAVDTPRLKDDLRKTLLSYALSATVIVVCGFWLPLIGVALAHAMGWSNALVGTLLIAMATSAPELAASFAALRLGAVDMAVANLLGSNLFDMLILVVDDIANGADSLYANASPEHLATATFGMLMTGVVLVALRRRDAPAPGRLGAGPGALLVLLYGAHLWVQIAAGG